VIPGARPDARIVRVDSERCRIEDLAPAVSWLRGGGVVVIPTDTSYGLAVDIRNDAAVRRLFALKGRSPRAALPLIAAGAAQVVACTGALGSREAALAAAFWPGPLSLVRDAPGWMAAEVHGGHRTVAIRVPAHAVARQCCAAWGAPLSATSANLSGAPPANSIDELGPIAEDPHVFVIDAGVTPGGLPSTLVDVRAAVPLLVRDGAIAWRRVLDCIHA
jgi:L-threonylcarbamoyladenylate synthase